MKLISRFVLVVAFLFSSSILAKDLVLKCDLKFANSPSSKAVKLKLDWQGGVKEISVKLNRYTIKMKGAITGQKYGTKVMLVFEVISPYNTPGINAIGGLRRQLNRVSYGSFGRIEVDGYEGSGPKLIAVCRI